MNSTKINYGGPAFPHSSQPLDAQGNPMCGEHSEWGMTLRDYFAGQALAALINQLANTSKADKEMKKLGMCEGQFDRLCAKCAYDYADAMLKAREAKP